MTRRASDQSAVRRHAPSRACACLSVVHKQTTSWDCTTSSVPRASASRNSRLTGPHRAVYKQNEEPLIQRLLVFCCAVWAVETVRGYWRRERLPVHCCSMTRRQTRTNPHRTSCCWKRTLPKCLYRSTSQMTRHPSCLPQRRLAQRRPSLNRCCSCNQCCRSRCP